MGEALPGGHAILNHNSERIHVTQRAIKEMDMRNFLRRDRESGLRQIKPEFVDIMAEMEYGTRLMRELGSDFSGPAVPICTCPDCRRLESDLDRTLTPDEQLCRVHEESEAAVRAVRSKRLQ